MFPVVYIIAFVLAITAIIIVLVWGIAKLMAHYNVTLPETNYLSSDEPATETAESISKIVVTDLDRASFKVGSAILGTGILGMISVIRSVRFEKWDNIPIAFLVYGILVYGLKLKNRFAAVASLCLALLDVALAAYSQRYWGAVALLGITGVIMQGVASLFRYHSLKSRAILPERT